MTAETTPTEHGEKKIEVRARGGSSDTVYAMGLIGAWMFYFRRATTTQERVQAFFKAFIWPVTLVYEALNYFKKE
jgi:hypothetical protein